jgi:DNA polymerase I-like protein with 3'-5' exonuclease and polymerase domains
MKPLLPASAKICAVDTETTGQYPDEGARVASVSVAWRYQGRTHSRAFNFLHPGPQEKPGVYIQLLEELCQRQLVFHNAAYDIVMLDTGPQGKRVRAVVGPRLLACLKWDTMLAHRILYPTSEAGLGQAAEQVGLIGKQGVEELQAWLKEHKFKKYEYAKAPWELAGPYVTADAEQTIELFYEQRARLMFAAMRKGSFQHGLYRGADDRTSKVIEAEIEREFALTRVLTRLEMTGVLYDVKQSREIAVALTERKVKLEARLPFNPSINKAKAYFFDECGLEADRHSEKTGAPSLDKEQIRDWAMAGVPWVQEYKEWKWANDAVNRWYGGYAEKTGADGRLRVRYTQAEVTSGRLSAKRVNLQAMPKKDKIEQDIPGPRELMRASKDHELWSLDMSQAELRIAAQYARCDRMKGMLEDGTDFHRLNAIEVLHADPDAPGFKDQRDIGKKLTFASLYMIGGEALQKLLARESAIHLPLHTCEQMVWDWRAFWPEFPRAARAAAKVFEARGWVKILKNSDHETRSYLQMRDNPFTGWNRMVQGSLAAWMRLWLVEIEECYPGSLVLTVHDSAVLDLPTRSAKKITDDIRAKGCARASEIFGLQMPIDGERIA